MNSSWTRRTTTATATTTTTAPKISQVHIRAYRAIDDVKTSMRFAEGHAAVLAHHGIQRVASANAEWVNDPDVYVIIATSPGGEKIYGGARIQIRRPDRYLPLETAFAKYDKNIHQVIGKMQDEGCGELCALWNSMEVAGFGIGSRLIINCAVSMTQRLKIRHLLALTSPVTRRFIPAFGFYTIPNIGIDGGIPYPTERLKATVAHFINPDRLVFMDQELNKQAKELMINPRLNTTSTGPRGSLNLCFDLGVSR